MRLKGLVLSTAFFLAPSSVTFSAETISIQNEPESHVRICDAYGSGFFYIPGSETCLRLSGYIRTVYEHSAADLEPDPGIGSPADEDFDQVFWGTRGRLNIDTRNETDFGTLRSIFRLEGGDSNIDVDIDLDVALISIAGFRFGFAGANYWTSNHLDGGVDFEGVADVLPLAEDQGFTGFDDATLFDYTAAVNGVAFTIGAEDPRIGESDLGFIEATSNGELGASGTLVPIAGSVAGAHLSAVALGQVALNPAIGAISPAEAGVLAAPQTSSDARANFYIGAHIDGAFGEIGFTAVHDSTAVDSRALAFGALEAGGFAYKVSVLLDLSNVLVGGLLYGSYAYDGDYITNYVHTEGSGVDDAEQIFQISGQTDLTQELVIMAQYSEAFGSDWGRLIRGKREQARSFSIGVNYFPELAPDFSIRASYTSGEVENPVNIIQNDFDQAPGAGFDFDSFSITVRRDF